MNTDTPLPETPPDYIRIPGHLQSMPVPWPNLPPRLKRVLQERGVQVLGELDGCRLSDFEAYRGCGETTILALRWMIIAALHPGVQWDLTSPPLPMGWCRRAQPAFAVPRALHDLSVEDLPVSARLRRVLSDMRVTTLGQMHGLRFADVAVRRETAVRKHLLNSRL